MEDIIVIVTRRSERNHVFLGRVFKMCFPLTTAISLAPGFSPVPVRRGPNNRFNGFFRHSGSR
jgi:hypothetical protein